MQLHQLTPTQIEAHRARKAFLSRIAARAVQEVPAVKLVPADDSPPAPVEVQTVEIPEDEWAKRQVREWYAKALSLGVRPVHHRVGADGDVLRIRTIQHAVARRFNIAAIELSSRRRTKAVVQPRQVAMFLAKDLTLASYPEIGRKFCKDHTTVLHAVRRIAARIDREPEFSAFVESLRASLREQTA